MVLLGWKTSVIGIGCKTFFGGRVLEFTVMRYFGIWGYGFYGFFWFWWLDGFYGISERIIFGLLFLLLSGMGRGGLGFIGTWLFEEITFCRRSIMCLWGNRFYHRLLIYCYSWSRRFLIFLNFLLLFLIWYSSDFLLLLFWDYFGINLSIISTILFIRLISLIFWNFSMPTKSISNFISYSGYSKLFSSISLLLSPIFLFPSDTTPTNTFLANPNPKISNSCLVIFSLIGAWDINIFHFFL